MPVHAATPAAREPWSVTLYAGPATTKFFGAVFTSGRLEPTAAMVGLAADGRLADLGYGISLAGEGQVTQYWFGHHNTTLALGLGFQVDEPFGLRGTRFSVYDGPSYAFDPPYTAIGYHGAIYVASRNKFENYISLEYAVSLPKAPEWSVVGRFYHRSGAWGLYTNSDDDGLAFGIGVQYRFF